ncbi:MAG: 3-carboxy-cis,cis-muconate cycloisomerase [Geminicoccaceae bacterium]|nr:3-carboxy-cis,cis-muconate cycloisomerase [Geminicoccaceae bacterium]MCX7629102.1 3-carboxy-cis,cis-muconate cycloisomerase [Geminicoccaceae bacterium]
MSVCAFDHPVLSALLGDEEIAPLFSSDAELAAMLRFEAALARAQAAEDVIPSEAAAAIAALCARFEPEIDRLRRGVARDGVVVPELVRALRTALGEPHARFLHLGATSQDLIDTGSLLRLARVLCIFDERLRALVERLLALEAAWGDRRLQGRTRMRRARPISWAHKLASWRAPLERHRVRLAELRPRLLRLSWGGAVGDRAELGAKARAVADRLADDLGLARSDRAGHTERDGIVEFGSWLALVAGSLGKLGADVTILAQDEVAELVVEGGGGSSAMPGKVNPIAAEILVTLARFTAVLAGGLHHASVHENERSGQAWTLEWLLLPQLCVATGAATRLALRLLESLRLPEPSGSG